MHRTRRPRRSSARLAFSLPLVLALLALACVPAFAHADSAGIEYESGVPTAEGGEGTAKHGSNIPKAKTSKSGTGGTTSSGPESNETSESERSSGGSSSGNGPGGKDGGTGQGNQGNGSNGQQNQGGNQQAGISQTPTAVSSPSHQSSGGDSSPLVPILIAVAVLAAISVGVVVIRQRRQGSDSGSTISPKAS